MAKYTYGGNDADTNASYASSRWYKEKKDVHSFIFGYLKHLNDNQSEMNDDFYRFMRMYGSMPYLDVVTRTTISEKLNQLPRLTLNVVKSACDTIHSKMSKNQPKPMFLTDGGNWAEQRKAKKLTKFIEGQFYLTDAYKKGAQAMMHSLILGTGCLKVWHEDGEIKMEPVLVDELYVDKFEAVYGDPRQIHQTKRIHRDVLSEMFPKKAGEIAQAKCEPFKTRANGSENPDMILVVESWSLPNGDKPGRHVIAVDTTTLLDEEYKCERFPFHFLRWRELPMGFWGQGIPEEVKGIQIEINKLLQTIQLSMHLGSIPKLMIEQGSKVSLKSLDNKIGGIIRYTGTLPTPMSMLKVPVELFTHLEWLYQKAWEIIGVSQLSGASQKPSGLDSGKALREFNDIESERFLAFGREYENFYMGIAKHMIEMVSEMAEDGVNSEVKVMEGKFMETIKWSEVKLKEDAYIMQVFPTSALSNTPAARLNEVNDLINMGFIGKEQAMKLLNFPDLEAAYEFELAAEDDIDKVIAEIVDKANYLPPEPYQNLEMGIKRMQQAYLLYRTKDLSEEKLEMLRMWTTSASAMLDEAAAAQQQQMLEQQQAVMPAPMPAEQPPMEGVVPDGQQPIIPGQ